MFKFKLGAICEKPRLAIGEKPVPLRLLDRFVSGVNGARAPDQTAAVGVAAASL